MNKDADSLKAPLKQHVAAANNSDLEGYGRTLASNVVCMPPDSSSVAGRGKVLEWMKAAFFDLYIPAFSAVFDDIEVSGDRALATGWISLELVPKAGGPKLAMTGKFLNTFARQDDGSWKYMRAIWNLDHPISCG